MGCSRVPGNLIQIPVCIVAIVCALMINPWGKKKGKRSGSVESAETAKSAEAA